MFFPSSRCQALIASLFLLSAGSALSDMRNSPPDLNKHASADTLQRPYPEAISAWSEEIKEKQRKAAVQFMQQLSRAIKEGKTELILERGHYRFDRKVLNIPGATDLTIDGSGSTFWFHPLGGAIHITEAKNLKLQNIYIDYDPLPFTQGTIKDWDESQNSLDIKIDRGYPVPSAITGGSGKAIYFNNEGYLLQNRWDRVTGVEQINDDTIRATLYMGRVFRFAEESKNLRPGKRFAFICKSGHHSIRIINSEKVTLRNLTGYASSSFFVLESYGIGGHHYDGLRIIQRPGTNRLMACVKDIIHSNHVEKGPLIENSEFSRAGDDNINIHNEFFLVYKRISDKKLMLYDRNTVKYLRGQSSHETPFLPGEEINFFQYGTWTPKGRGTVKNMELVTDEHLVEDSRGLIPMIRDKGFVSRDFPASGLWKVEFENEVTAEQLDLAAWDFRCGRGAVIRNNLFHNTGWSAGRIILSSDSIVENNTFKNIPSEALTVQLNPTALEGPVPKNITIRDNVFVNCGFAYNRYDSRSENFGVISVTLHRGHLTEEKPISNINIIRNKIIRPASVGILLTGTKEALIEGNTIINPVSHPPLGAGAMYGMDASYAIFLHNVEDVVLKDNTIKEMSPYCLGEIGFSESVKGVKNNF